MSEAVLGRTCSAFDIWLSAQAPSCRQRPLGTSRASLPKEELHEGQEASISGGLSPYALRYSSPSLPRGATISTAVFAFFLRARLSPTQRRAPPPFPPSFVQKLKLTSPPLRPRSRFLLSRSRELAYKLRFPKIKEISNRLRKGALLQT